MLKEPQPPACLTASVSDTPSFNFEPDMLLAKPLWQCTAVFAESFATNAASDLIE